MFRFLSIGILLTLLSACKVYTFRDISIPPEVKTVKVNFIENKARYVNPQLSPRLTNSLQERIVNQTRLTRTNEDNADWIISGTITNYGITTSGISSQQVSMQQLSITVELKVRDNTVEPFKVKDYSVVKSYEFPASQTLQTAEQALGNDIIRGLTDEIFNRIFSNW